MAEQPGSIRAAVRASLQEEGAVCVCGGAWFTAQGGRGVVHKPRAFQAALTSEAPLPLPSSAGLLAHSVPPPGKQVGSPMAPAWVARPPFLHPGLCMGPSGQERRAA